MEKKQIKCPHCKGINLIKRGFRITQNRGKIQRYTCKDCGFRFVQNNGFFRMRNTPQKITLCLDLFYKGVSTRKVQEHLQAFYPQNSSHVSIYKWVVKYSNIISKFTDSLKVKVGNEVQVDEMEYQRRKSHKQKRGTENNWFIDSIDTETRFMVASDYYNQRGMKQVKEIIKIIKERTQKSIPIITTDGWMAYEKAIKNTFGYNLKENKYNTIHHKVTGLKGEGFNYPIERLHNSIRARTKIFRGFHGSVDSARAIMKGYSIYYNFIRKHQGIGKCPYEVATDLKLNSKNRWMELINLCC